MHVGSAFFFDINTQEDLDKAMLASFKGIFDGGGVPELRLIEELIEAVQNEKELAHLTLDIPDVLDFIRKDQTKNLNPKVKKADIRNYITMYHVLKDVPEYLSIMEGVQKSFNLYILNSNSLPAGWSGNSNISIAVIPGRYEALWITGQEIDLKNSKGLTLLNVEFQRASERIATHASALKAEEGMDWLHGFKPKDAGVYEEKLSNILFGRPLNAQPLLSATGPVIEHVPATQ